MKIPLRTHILYSDSQLVRLMISVYKRPNAKNRWGGEWNNAEKVRMHILREICRLVIGYQVN